MAEGFLKSFDPDLEVHSAGTYPASSVARRAVTAMDEIGIDISEQYPKPVDQFLNMEFDYVITVCDNANKDCPIFTGKVANRLHIGFDDPTLAVGTEEQIMSEYRRVRDEIRERLKQLYEREIKNQKSKIKNEG
jgi:arsenate reductase